MLDNPSAEYIKQRVIDRKSGLSPEAVRFDESAGTGCRDAMSAGGTHLGRHLGVTCTTNTRSR